MNSWFCVFYVTNMLQNIHIAFRNVFWCLQFPPKNEWNNSTLHTTMSMIPQVDLFSFVFWRKSKTLKNHFEIIWHSPIEAVVWYLFFWEIEKLYKSLRFEWLRDFDDESYDSISIDRGAVLCFGFIVTRRGKKILQISKFHQSTTCLIQHETIF